MLLIGQTYLLSTCYVHSIRSFEQKPQKWKIDSLFPREGSLKLPRKKQQTTQKSQG